MFQPLYLSPCHTTGKRSNGSSSDSRGRWSSHVFPSVAFSYAGCHMDVGSDLAQNWKLSAASVGVCKHPENTHLQKQHTLSYIIICLWMDLFHISWYHNICYIVSQQRQHVDTPSPRIPNHISASSICSSIGAMALRRSVICRRATGMSFWARVVVLSCNKWEYNPAIISSKWTELPIIRCFNPWRNGVKKM